jgi:hypothetical protein
MDEPTAGPDEESSTTAESEAEAEAEAKGITARYRETDAERLLEFDLEGETAVVAQNREGYAMLTVRESPTGEELERYYGFDMALDHAAELLGASPHDLPVPEEAADIGM